MEPILSNNGLSGKPGGIQIASHDSLNEIITLTYDNTTCEATSNNLYFGPLVNVSTLQYTGQECVIGNTGSHAFDYTGTTESLFFLIVATDTVVEGSYGEGNGTERAEANLCPQTQDLMARCDAGP